MENSKQSFLLGLFGGIAVIAVIAVIILAVALIGGKNDSGNVAGVTNTNINNPNQPGNTNIGSANVTGVVTYSERKDAEICTQDGKPVVYLFSTTWCPHCSWIKDTFDNTAQKYIDSGDIIAYHWEVDTYDNTLTSEIETVVPPDHLAIYQDFNPNGSIPTFVFGCKYFRVGNGFEQTNDLSAEAAEFEALIQEMIR
ncbi:MAG TPA: thioredoxin family protein [Patescibacteria group bacterium]|nr:thioredoxin family protein [Patescibacteria group bacterium]